MSTNVSGPTHLVVGPVLTGKATSGKEATFVVSLRPGSLGQASCFSGPPPGSLNDLCAIHRSFNDVDTPLQSVLSPRTRNIYALVSGNGSWPVSSRGIVPLYSLVQVGHFLLDLDLVGASLVQW